MTEKNTKEKIQEADKELFQKAIFFRDEGHFSKALSIVSKLLEKYPKSISIIAVSARLNWKLKNLRTAIELFERAVELQPKSETLSLALFHCLWDSDERYEALEEAKRFTSISYSRSYIEIIRAINNEGAGSNLE